MMVVLGNLETAQRIARQTDNSNLHRALTNAMRGAQRASSLTQRLLAFSRRATLNPKPLDLNKFMVGSAEFLKRALGEMIEIETVGSAGLWTVEVDSDQLEVALSDLAINARDAMPAGGKLTVEAANAILDREYCKMNLEVSPGQYVMVSVSDTGCGMTKDTMSRVFEPFFTTKEIGHGTGLGLSQVYGFVKQSGGHIRIYSEVGQGTTVKIYLPRFFGRGVEDHLIEGELLGQGEGGETILLVEDDDDVRAYLTDVLRGLAYGVVAASSANHRIGHSRSGQFADRFDVDRCGHARNDRPGTCNKGFEGAPTNADSVYDRIFTQCRHASRPTDPNLEVLAETNHPERPCGDEFARCLISVNKIRCTLV